MQHSCLSVLFTHDQVPSSYAEYNIMPAGDLDKRQRLEPDREKRWQAMWATCSGMLKKMREHSGAWPFQQPVDPVK